MNRRSILSTLCTGALALLAPVVAWAKPRRWVGFHNRGIKPMVITPREDLTPEQLAEFKCLYWRNSPGHTYALVPESDSNTYFWDGIQLHALEPREQFVKRREAPLRALLAEARPHLASETVSFKRKDGTTWQWIRPLEGRDDLLSRIDDALKGDKRNA